MFKKIVHLIFFYLIFGDYFKNNDDLFKLSLKYDLVVISEDSKEICPSPQKIVPYFAIFLDPIPSLLKTPAFNATNGSQHVDIIEKPFFFNLSSGRIFEGFHQSFAMLLASRLRSQ